MTLGDLLTAAVRRHGERVAVLDGDRAMTYGEVGGAAENVASNLAAHGVRRGDRVVLLLPNCLELAPAVFGTVLAGAVAVLCPRDATEYQLDHIVRDSSPRALLTWGRPDAPQRCPTIDVGAAIASRAPSPAVGARPIPEPGDIALLIYTSGSTSHPRAVVSRHHHVSFVVDAIADRVRYAMDDVVFDGVPPSFDYGLYQLFLCTAVGACLVAFDVDRASASHAAAAIDRSRASVVPVTPTMARWLVPLIRRSGPAPSVRLVTSTGSTLTERDRQNLRWAFPGAAIVAMYGLTECKRISIDEPDGDRVRPGSVGRPLAGTTVTIVDDEGRPVAPGELGEIVVSGPHVMDGYWRDPVTTASRFVAGPNGLTLRTGDIGRIDLDGHVYVSGRRDDIFKQRGVRTSTTEIESAALTIAEVGDAALVVTKAGATLFVTGAVTGTEVLRALVSLVGRARAPERCIVLDSLPLTTNGKPDRAALARRPVG